MNHVLYMDDMGDSFDRAETLKKLRDNKISYTNLTSTNNDAYQKWKECENNLEGVVVLIENIHTQLQYHDLLRNNKNLHYVKITKLPTRYFELENEDYELLEHFKVDPKRILICEYSSKELIPFVQNAIHQVTVNPYKFS